MAMRIAPEIERRTAPSTETRPERSGGWFTRIGYRIKLALSGDGEELLLENNTPLFWHVYHDFHQLGMIDPGEARVFRLQKRGNFSVRPSQESDVVEYLVLPLNSKVKRAQIYRRHIAQEIETYEMQAA